MPKRIYTHEVVAIVGHVGLKIGDKVSVDKATHRGGGWWQGRFARRGEFVNILLHIDYNHPYPKVKLEKIA